MFSADATLPLTDINQSLDLISFRPKKAKAPAWCNFELEASAAPEEISKWLSHVVDWLIDMELTELRFYRGK